MGHSSTSSDTCFTTSPLPTPTPRCPFDLVTRFFGRKETAPAWAKDSAALPSERLLGQWLCPVPYQPWGEGVGLEDWNLNAIVFFVKFPLGGVSPPSCSLACMPALPFRAFFHTPARGGLACGVKRCLCGIEPKKCSLEMICAMMTFLFFLCRP